MVVVRIPAVLSESLLGMTPRPAVQTVIYVDCAPWHCAVHNMCSCVWQTWVDMKKQSRVFKGLQSSGLLAAQRVWMAFKYDFALSKVKWRIILMRLTHSSFNKKYFHHSFSAYWKAGLEAAKKIPQIYGHWLHTLIHLLPHIILTESGTCQRQDQDAGMQNSNRKANLSYESKV